MSLWRQLRWRIVGGHMVVVLVGVTILLLTAQLIIWRTAPADIQAHLAVLTQTNDNNAIALVTTDLLQTFQWAVLSSLLVAGLASIVAGLITSLLLTREILRPLDEIAQSSQRIANGHYDERVAVPGSDELAQMATHFNQMAESLAQTEQQRVALIGNVSHELRTPLTGIEGYLEGLMDGVFPSEPETFAPMYQEVRRLRRLVDDLQALAKVEAGQITLHLQNFDLVPLIERLILQLQPQAMVQGIDIKRVGADMVMIYADPDRAAQVLLNLIGNAIRYSPDGGQITVGCRLALHCAEITVQDTGLGLPPEALPYLFERFYRVDQSRARQSGGSGIGLTISRHLAWAMAGELTAASDGPGLGSTFTLTLPLARPETVADKPQ